MSCLLAGIAALLALAMPAAIARASLVGACILIAIFTALAITTVIVRAQRRRAAGVEAQPRARVVGILVVAAVYVAVVTLVHLTA